MERYIGGCQCYKSCGHTASVIFARCIRILLNREKLTHIFINEYINMKTDIKLQQLSINIQAEVCDFTLEKFKYF